MASTKLIIVYKAYFLEPIHKKLVSDGCLLSITEVDQLLKSYGDCEKSTKEMTNEELHQVIEWSIQFGYDIGLNLGYKEDDIDKQINLKIK